VSVFRKIIGAITVLSLFCVVFLVNTSLAQSAGEKIVGVQDHLNSLFAVIVGYVELVLFFKIFQMPLIIAVLVLGGILFTIRYNFINLRLFGHAVEVVMGKHDNPEDPGEISHFKALTSALAATVGLGNIAGVAIAITAGGPGAVFWMWLAGLFGMSMKFSSCTLAHLYRDIGEDGRVIGGPMVYLKKGISERVPAMAWLGRIFSPLFAVLTIVAAVGGVNIFQGNQTSAIIADIFRFENVAFLSQYGDWVVGIALATLTGIVIIGGIKRIGEVTCRMVPAMCVGYIGVCLVILGTSYRAVPEMMVSIFVQAFHPEAIFGGFMGVLIQGIRRAARSNEAGLGSAAIAHAAAKTSEPVREGLVAMLGPFIDTIIVCTMTALAILITKAHLGNEPGTTGIVITVKAFASVSGVLPYFLGIAVFVFAFSTIISWSYYGERASEYLFGKTAIMPYRIVYVAAATFGPVLALDKVIDFSDMMMLSMGFPNIIGMVLISGKVKELKDDYIARLRAGKM